MDNITDPAFRSNVAYGVAGPVAGANKLWLSVFSGETLAAYDQANIFEQLVDHKVLSGGVAWEFPITGSVSILAAWNAGVELGGGSNTNASSTIAVKLDKRPIAAHFEIDNIDLMQTQWEFRAELARQAGLSLANARDKQIAAYIGRAAVESPISTDPRGIVAAPVFISATFENLGALITPAASGTLRAAAALEALRAAEDFLVWLQTINAPTDGVYLAVTPRAFQDIRALGVARSDTEARASQPMFGGAELAGGLGLGLKMGLNNLSDTLDYMGVKIIKSNHLPVVDYSVNAAANIGETRYNLNFLAAGCVGLIFQKSAVASLKLQGLKMDTVDDVRRNTTFTVASAMNGTGVLRPECAAMLIGRTAANTAAGAGALFNSSASNAVSVDVDAANVGGAEAGVARTRIQGYLGANFTAEFVVTTAGAFPYLNT
jgi:hypothetical protein